MRYEIVPNGDLIVSISHDEQEQLQALRDELGDEFGTDQNLFESLIANSELSWISPEHIGALTDAPILGIQGASGELGDVDQAWAFMDYALRSPQDDLADKGRVRFVSGN